MVLGDRDGRVLDDHVLALIPAASTGVHVLSGHLDEVIGEVATVLNGSPAVADSSIVVDRGGLFRVELRGEERYVATAFHSGDELSASVRVL